MGTIESLEPKAVWRNFYSLTQVPRPSGHMEKITEFLLGFGKKLGLEAYVDAAGNVIIKKPASTDYENRKTVILQAHMDMVPQKESDVNHDFEKDPIDAYIDGDWVTARGTTLGADDGLGVAAIMSVMEDDHIAHGPLVGLITRDEETGMYGAFGIKEGMLQGDILLNLDSESEGELFIGCAGGTDVNVSLQYRDEEVPAGLKALKVILSGLHGGHSGMEICEGYANANKLMARFLFEAISHHQVHLSSWEGGNMRNAIPRYAEAVITVAADKVENVKNLVKSCGTLYNAEFEVTEKNNIKFVAEEISDVKTIVPAEIQDNVVDALLAVQNGVMRYIPTIPSTVETSSNLAIVKVGTGEVDVKFLVRSSDDTMKDYLNKSIGSCFSMAGMKVTFTGSYSGWKPNVASPILAAMRKSYEEQFNQEPKVSVIHAGLECGVIGAVVTGLDMISFGPTLRSPHTPNEGALIASVPKFWDFLVATLKRTPEK
jgi:dipeptidase D